MNIYSPGIKAIHWWLFSCFLTFSSLLHFVLPNVPQLFHTNQQKLLENFHKNPLSAVFFSVSSNAIKLPGWFAIEAVHLLTPVIEVRGLNLSKSCCWENPCEDAESKARRKSLKMDYASLWCSPNIRSKGWKLHQKVQAQVTSYCHTRSWLNSVSGTLVSLE